MTDLARLDAAREAAWRELNAAERALPDCEHVTAWKEQIAAARKAHQAAIREYDRAALAVPETAEPEAQPEPEPASPSLPENISHQEPLPGLEAA